MYCQCYYLSYKLHEPKDPIRIKAINRFSGTEFTWILDKTHFEADQSEEYDRYYEIIEVQELKL